ncbi:MAG: NADH-quinone oxidoreductase subunit K [Candidatus Methanospirareceae archaeon]
MEMDVMSAAIVYITAFAILLIGYHTAISSRDLIRLLISLELMFGSVFLSLIPLFSSLVNTAFGIAIITVFASCCECMVLIAAIVMLDREKRNIFTSSITMGGDKV